MGSRSLTLLMLFVLLAPAPTVGAEAFLTADTPYVAQTTWGVKHSIGLDDFALWGRSPWIQDPAGRGVRVAVIDTGIEPSHPDLQGRTVAWRDFVGSSLGGGSPVPYDDNGHGTHVAGIIAAGGHLEPHPFNPYWVTGMRGVAPEAELMVAKAMGPDGRGEDAKVAEAVRWAVDPNGDGDLSDGAHIINLSLGIQRPSSTSPASEPVVGSRTRVALQDAVARGVVVVVSSGNDGLSHVSDPGDLDAVITVAATDRSGDVADFSNHGRYLDVVAPGIIVSTFPRNLDVRDGRQDGYAGMAGTSMAAPVVSGLVALAMEANPALQAKSTTRDMTGKVLAVQDLVRSYATPTQEASGERASYGLVNAYATLTKVDAGSSVVDMGAVAVLSLVAVGSLFLVSRFVGWLRSVRRPGYAKGSFGPEPPRD